MTTETRTHYDVLGVSHDAPEAVIKAAHRALARNLHPDREGGSDEAFAEVNAAADVLLDPTARAAYDAELTAAQTTPEPAAPEEPAPWGIEEELVVEDVVEEPAEDTLPAPAPEPETARRAPSRFAALRAPGWVKATIVVVPLALIAGLPLVTRSAPAAMVAVLLALTTAWARHSVIAMGILAVASLAAATIGGSWVTAVVLVIGWLTVALVAVLNQEAR